MGTGSFKQLAYNLNLIYQILAIDWTQKSGGKEKEIKKILLLLTKHDHRNCKGIFMAGKEITLALLS